MIPLSPTSWNLPVILAIVVTQLIIRIEGYDYERTCAYQCNRFHPPGNDGAYKPNCDHISNSDEKDICQDWVRWTSCDICGPKGIKGKEDCENQCENFRSWSVPSDDLDGPFYWNCDKIPSGGQDRLDCDFWLSNCRDKICAPKNGKEPCNKEPCEKFRPWAASGDDKDGPFKLDCGNAPDGTNCEAWKSYCDIKICEPKNGREQCDEMCQKFRHWGEFGGGNKDGPFKWHCRQVGPDGEKCELWKGYCDKQYCGPKNSTGSITDQCVEPCNKFRKPNKNGPYKLECEREDRIQPEDKIECEYWKSVCPKCGRKKFERESVGVSTDVIIIVSVTMLFLVSCGLAIGACAWSTNRNYWRYKNWMNQPPGKDDAPGEGGASDKNQNDSVTVGGDPSVAASAPVPNPSSNGPQ